MYYCYQDLGVVNESLNVSDERYEELNRCLKGSEEYIPPVKKTIMRNMRCCFTTCILLVYHRSATFKEYGASYNTLTVR